MQLLIFEVFISSVNRSIYSRVMKYFSRHCGASLYFGKMESVGGSRFLTIFTFLYYVLNVSVS